MSDLRTVRTFVARSSADEFTFALVTCDRTDKVQGPDDILPRLRAALTRWADETDDGRAAWEDSSEDFNVGDLSNQDFDGTLASYLAAEGLTGLTVEVVSDGSGVNKHWTYDTVLVEPGID